MRRSFQPMRRSSWSGSMLERSTSCGCRRSSLPTALRVSSSGPNRSLKAICCSSVRRWSWKTSTEYSWNAPKTCLNVAASSGRDTSTPSTSAPRHEWTGVIFILVGLGAPTWPPDPQTLGAPRRSRGAPRYSDTSHDGPTLIRAPEPVKPRGQRAERVEQGLAPSGRLLLQRRDLQERRVDAGVEIALHVGADLGHRATQDQVAHHA